MTAGQVLCTDNNIMVHLNEYPLAHMLYISLETCSLFMFSFSTSGIEKTINIVM